MPRISGRWTQTSTTVSPRSSTPVSAPSRSSSGSASFPRKQVTYEQPLDFADLPGSKPSGSSGSPRTPEDVAGTGAGPTDSCDLIFVDPDNGFRRSEHDVPRHRMKAVKHAYLDELELFGARGQSLVIYHHADRSASTDDQAMLRLDDLRKVVTNGEPLAAVRASRGSTRALPRCCRRQSCRSSEVQAARASDQPLGKGACCPLARSLSSGQFRNGYVARRDRCMREPSGAAPEAEHAGRQARSERRTPARGARGPALQAEARTAPRRSRRRHPMPAGPSPAWPWRSGCSGPSRRPPRSASSDPSRHLWASRSRCGWCRGRSPGRP